MSIKDLEDCFLLIDKNYGTSETGFTGPKSQSLIEESERILGIKFPITYRNFIENVGHGGPGRAASS